MKDKPWALILHKHNKRDNDIKSHICYAYLKFTGDKHPEYSHSSLLVWDEVREIYVHYYPTTEGLWLYEFKNIDEVLSFHDNDELIVVLFYPDEYITEAFEERTYNVNALTNIGFVKYALGVWRYEPVCSEWIQYVLNMWFAHDGTGKPVFHRDLTETPGTLASLIIDTYECDVYIRRNGDVEYLGDNVW